MLSFSNLIEAQLASSGGIQAPMVDQECGVYVSDNYIIWKLDQDTGARIWFSRFSDYSQNKLGSNDLRMVNDGEDGLVGAVFASGWHIWVDRRDGSPAVVKEPDPRLERAEPSERAKLTAELQAFLQSRVEVGKEGIGAIK